jgi:hypothetical protein
VAIGLRPTALWCSCFGARAKLASFAALTALRQTARSQITKRAAHAAPKPCAPRRHPRDPRAIRSLLRNFPSTPRFASARSARCSSSRCEASRVWCLPPPSDELSSTGLCGARASAHQQLTSRRLFERSERSERSEFGAAAKTEQRKAALAPRGPSRQGRFLCPLSLSTQRKGVGRRAETPALPHAVNKTDMRMRAQEPRRFDASAKRCARM